MTPYPRPWLSGSRRGRRPAYPYPHDLLRRHDIFPLLVLDGGAFFFTQMHLGGAAASDFMAAYDDGRLLAPWRDGRGLAWDRALEAAAGSACPPPLEQHVWLQRLYFLLPLAQAYLRSGDDGRARDWYRHLTAWQRAHPRPAGAESRCDWAWFDMQVTWRFLVLVHSVPHLAGSASMTPSRWRRVHRAMDQHATHILEHARAALEAGTGRGNHFLQKGVALLYAGLLFPEEAHAAACVDTGRAIVRQQLETEIHADGGSVEASPSYSHFIARLYLEAFLLLRDNGPPPIPGLERGLRQQYRHLAAIASPRRRSLQISDSYALDVEADLDIVHRLLPLRRPRRRSAHLVDSGIAVLHHGPFAAYLDAGPQDLWHHHQGRPNLLLYIDGQPLLVDSGCGTYDATLRQDYLKRPEAHNVIVTDVPPGAGDPTVTIEAFDARSVRVRSVQEVGTWRCAWTRRVSLEAGRVVVDDRLQASARISARLHWHLAPVNVVLRDGGRRALVQRPAGDVAVSVRGASAGRLQLTYRPAFGADNQPCTSPDLSCAARGRRLRFVTRIEP